MKRQSINQRKYDTANCKYYGLKLNQKTDGDIIAKLDTMQSVQGYIKQLVRNDISTSKAGADPVNDGTREGMEGTGNDRVSLFCVYSKTGRKATVILENNHVFLLFESGMKRVFNSELYTEEDYTLIREMFIREGYQIISID